MRLAALLALACALVGCAPEPQAPPKPKSLTRVTLNLNPSLTYGPLMIAKDEGFFADEGIDAELVSLDSNSALAALLSGKLDVLSTGVRSGVFNMILRGQPLQIVADKGHSVGGDCTSEAFVAPPEMAARIAERGTLRGERVAVVRGGVAEYLVARLLAHHKVSAKDVVMVNLPQGTPVTSRSKLDAIRYVGEPHLSSLLHDKAARVINTTEEVAPGHQSTVIVYGKRLLRDDVELGRRVMRAYLRGVRRYNEGKSERNVAIVSRYSKLPVEVVGKSCWVSVANDGTV
ncbi:MAG TPA: ABC transporter substrate-binding protein, partial [Thermoanaerobaculia bacterium]